MPVLESGHTISLWILVILVTSLQLLGVSARTTTTTTSTTTTTTTTTSTKPSEQTAPSLTVESRSRDYVTLVCRAPQSHQGVLFTLFRVTEQVQSSAAPGGSVEAVFGLNATHLAPAPQLYCCLYKNRLGVYSSFSPYLSLTPPALAPDQLPRPTLALQQQEGVWHLFCIGSEAYPGALFSLYRVDDTQTVATHQASRTGHQTAFPVPVLGQAKVRFECSYGALQGTLWSESERSLPLEVDQGLFPTPAKAAPSVDWPLVAGSFSAVVLFMAALVLMVLVVRRKVRGAAVEKKKREEAEFWSKSQGKDHVADLDPRHSTLDHECASGTAEPGPRSSVWNPLSTFTSPSLH